MNRSITPLTCMAACMLLLPCSTCFAQPDSTKNTLFDKNHFLWFSDHWNAAYKNVFVIDKDSAGMRGTGVGNDGDGGTVVVDPDGNVQLQTPGTDAWNKKVDE